MTDLRSVYLSIALNPLRAAYAAGHAPLVEEYDEDVSAVRQALKNKESGIVEEDWVDEETGRWMTNLDYQALCGQVSEDALQAHRKAFALMTFHVWEKHVCTYMDWPQYRGQEGFGDLKAAGWDIDCKGLKGLQLTANCIKHDSAALFDFDPGMFGDEILLFETDEVSRSNKGKRVNKAGHWTSWEDALRLTHEHTSVTFDGIEIGAVASRPIVSDVMIGSKRRIDFGPATVLHASIDDGRAGEMHELYMEELDRISEVLDVLAVGDLRHSVTRDDDRVLHVDAPRRTPLRRLAYPDAQPLTAAG